MADTLTPNYSFIIQQPGTNRNTWGGKLNANWTSIDALLFTASSNASAALSASSGALQRSGGTMTGDAVLADVGPTSALSAGFRGAPVVDFSVDKALALTDCGKTQRLTGATPRTLTIPPVGTVGFPVDTVIPLRNFSTSAALSIVRGAGVQLRVAGNATDKNCALAPQGVATLLHEANNVWVLSGVGAS